MVKTRVLNPQRRVTKGRRTNGPHLLIVNHGGRMAKAKKKRATPRRRTNTRRTNNPRRTPNKRRTHNARRRPNKRRTYNPRRVHHRRTAPVRHHRRRRHNPSLSGLTGLLEKTITALIGAGVTSWVYQMVGPMVPLGGIVGQVGIKLGLAWGLGELAKKAGFAKHAEMLSIGGAISAGQDVINFALPQVFPTAIPRVALPPGQALVPSDLTGDGTPTMSEIGWAPPGYGTLGDIGFGPEGSWLYS